MFQNHKILLKRLCFVLDIDNKFGYLNALTNTERLKIYENVCSKLISLLTYN